jgi:chaperonin cofactor prefoldin
MIIDEEKGIVFGTLDEREEMLEKIKEIALKKEWRKICYRIDELMQQIKQQEKDNAKTNLS